MFVTMEDNVRIGGYANRFRLYMQKQQARYQHLNFSVPECFVEQGGGGAL